MSLQPVCIDHPDQALPGKWAWAPLTSLAKLESGHTPRKTVEEYWANGTVPWICLQDIRDAHGKVIYETKFKTTPLGIQNSSARLLPEGTVCFSRDISVGFTTIMGQEMSTTQHFANWVCGPSIYNKYLMQALVASRHSLTESGEGTVVRTIYMPALERFHVALPPLNEQRRIVARIEELTARSKSAKEALQAIPPLLEKFRQSVLAAAFRGDLTAEWRRQNPDVEPAEVLLERIRVERRRRWEESGARGKYVEPEPVDASGLPELPRGWCWAKLESLVPEERPLCYGVVQPGDYDPAGVPLVRVCDLVANTVRMEELRTISAEVDAQYSRSRLEGGEVLISIVGTIGRTAIVPSEARGMNIARAVARVDLISVPAAWLTSYLSMFRVQELLVRESREVARKTLNLHSLRDLPIPIAPLAEMSQATAQIDSTSEAVNGLSLASVYRKLAEMGQSILSKAFRGELVPQDPNDETASDLLDRIRSKKPDPATKTRKQRS